VTDTVNVSLSLEVSFTTPPHHRCIQPRQVSLSYHEKLGVSGNDFGNFRG
jgi:hypothetical protein